MSEQHTVLGSGKKRDGEKEVFQAYYAESSKGFFDHIKTEPMVTVGGLALLGILAGGLYSVKTGNSKMSQGFMRARVMVQMGVIGLLVVGSGILFTKPNLPPLKDKSSPH